jgi:hypothetical protein
MIRRILNYISHGILKKNIKFKDKHKGEECYLFGNGGSIKYFELSRFSDKISFGCNSLHLHKNVLDLDMRYYVMMAPLEFCKYWRGVKSGIYIEKNPYYANVHKFAKDKKCNVFTHASNYIFTKKYDNFHYVHNFKRNKLSLNTLDFSSSSSFAAGGPVAMIGLAIYMGFKKIYLVGCDYWFVPRGEGHFYSLMDYQDGGNDFIYEDLMNVISDEVEIVVVTRNGSKSVVNYIEYSELTGVDEKKQSVVDIVSEEDLKFLATTMYLRR